MSPKVAAKNEPPVLTLSLSQDGALQQVLVSGDGDLQVGETFGFLVRWGDAVGDMILHSPISERVAQALAQANSSLTICAPKNLASLPWATWLEKDITWRDSQAPHDLQHLQLERSYRNVVSLSYDIVNSTELMADLGAEPYFELIKELHTEFARIGQASQGKSDVSQGDDGCMCYFGADRAHEHAAQFAMEAAYKMQITAASKGWPIRIGLAQGWVALEGAQPVGLSVHMAARVQKAANVGSVWLTQDIQAKLVNRFTFAPVGNTQVLKGFGDQVRMFELLAPIARFNHFAETSAQIHQGVDCFIGRVVETQTLIALWRKVCEGQGQDCLVHGVAGIGKSTFLRHTLRLFNAPRVVHLHANPHDERVVMGTLRSWMASEFGVTRHAPIQEQAEQLKQTLTANPEWKKFESALQDLFGLATCESQFEEPLAQHRHTMHSMLEWARDEANKSPLVIIIDDYQWADASTKEWVRLLKSKLCAGFALFLIVCERTDESSLPTYFEPHHNVSLKPLSAADSCALIAKVAPRLASNSQWIGVLQARAQGIPLFLRETAILFDSTDQRAKIERAQKLGQALDVPANLQDLLLQRLDQLKDLKKYVQTASIIGQEFTWEDVLELQGKTTPKSSSTSAAALDQILKSGVWLRPPKQAVSMSDHHVLAFSHGMLRDVAYQSMWESDRRNLHATAAQMLAIKQSNNPFQATQLARHWAAAGETILAIDQLLAEGKASKRRGAHSVAVQCMEAALQLLYTQTLTPETIAKRVDAHLTLAGQIMVTQGYAASALHEHSMRAIELSQTLGAPKSLLRAQLSLQSIYFMRGDFADAHRLLDESTLSAAQVNHPLTTLQHQWACGNLAFYEGDFVSAERIMAGCVQWCDDHGLGRDLIQNPKIMAQMYRAYSLWCLGRAGDAIEAAQLGCEWADAGLHRLTRVQAHGIAAMVYYGCGQWRETLDSANRAFASCEQGEYAMWLAHAGFMRGAAMVQLGEYQSGIVQMRIYHARWADSGGILTRSYYWAVEAEILKNNQDVHGAKQIIMQAKQMMMKIPERYYASEVRRISACLHWDASKEPELKLAAYAQLIEAYRDATHRRAWGLAFRLATSMLECCRAEPALTSSRKQKQADECMLECVQHLQPSSLNKQVGNKISNQISPRVIPLDQFRKTVA